MNDLTPDEQRATVAAIVSDFRCPFCGARAGASSNPPAVVHALPMCDKFRDLEPADYLAAVRAELGKLN